jgi:hypothetical protein
MRHPAICWLEHELTAVHSRLEQALVELRGLMGAMSPVRTHEVAVLKIKEDKESVELVRIQKGMKAWPPEHEGPADGGGCPAVRNGRRKELFEEEGLDWRERMRESTWAHQERIDMVVGARIAEMDAAARAGRVYVVSCTPRLVRSAIQARQLGKDIMMWLAKGCNLDRLLPEGMVKPEERTDEHVLTVLEHWLEHGDLSTTVPKNVTKHQRNNHTQQRERGDKDKPWVVTLTLSGEIMTTGKVLGKAVGQEVLSFQRRDAPLEIQPRMHQQVGVWHSGKRDRDQSGR